MKILITGSSGLIGSALVKTFIADGHDVGRLLRKKGPERNPYWNPESQEIDLYDFKEPDAVVHLAGDNISEGRWTQAKKSRIVDSRVKGTRLLSNYMAQLSRKPRVFISGSAIGFYGNHREIFFDETSPQGSGFLADLCGQWEEATTPAVKAGIRVVKIRTGMVLSSSGGALKKMLLPFTLGLGGILGNGNQYMSWISIQDVVGAILFLIKNDSVSGPVNLVSPTPVTNTVFTKTLGSVLHRPTLLPMTGFVARIVFGEMADELLLASARVAPKKLTEAGYRFSYPYLAGTLQHHLKKVD
jgi:uncharacterized protein (TIGR01777 family)